MKEYEFYQDERVTVWRRDYFTILANSREEACKKMREKFSLNSLETDDEALCYDSELISDTMVSIKGTRELYDDDDNLIIKEEG